MAPPFASTPTPVSNPTSPYWLRGLPPALAPRPAPAPHRPTPLPHVADVAIIGGGIAGVSAAYHLRKMRPDLQVVLFEARKLSHGATGRNGGLLWPALNAPWLKTAARYGTAEARRMMSFELLCLSEVRDFITAQRLEEEVRFAPFPNGAYYLFEDAAEMEAELAELHVMQQAGVHRDVTPLSAAQTAALLGTRAYAGAAQQPGVARVWAARLVHAIARMAAAAGPGEGLVVAEETRVAAVEPLVDAPGAPALAHGSRPAEAHPAQPRDAAGGAANNIVPKLAQVPLAEELDPLATPLLRVVTERGESVLARRVLHCTNAYSSALLPELRRALVPVRNHVAATPPAGKGGPAMPLDAAFYARGGYVYFSRREDGRVVVGGFRDVVPHMEWGVYDDGSLEPVVRSALHAYLPAHFPAAFPPGGALEVDAEWSGILGFTQDRFPFVGPVPGRRGQFLAAGFSGHGMTRGFTVGRVVAGMLAGAAPDPAFPAAWLPAVGRFGEATPVVPGPEAAAGAVYV